MDEDATTATDGTPRGHAGRAARLAFVLALACGAMALVPEAPAGAATVPSSAACRAALPVGASVVATAATPDGSGYWEVDQFGDVAAFGDAPCDGSLTGTQLDQPVVGMAADPSGHGYWLVTSDGGVFAFGDAPFLGSMGGTDLAQPVVGMAAAPSGRGYWLVASDGGVSAFGDAAFHGSMGGTDLNQPVVGMAAAPSGGGYLLVATDGGVFAFGDAAFHGSMGGTDLNQPVVGMAAAPSDGGYWLVAADGGVFAFGDARYLGSMGGTDLAQPVVGLAATPSDAGYRLVAAGGGVFAFGDATYLGRATVPASPRSCTGAQLSIGLGPASGAAGSVGQRVVITDASSASCTLYGYPGLLMMDTSGTPLPTHVMRTGTTPQQAVTLAPGAQASFLAHWPDATGYPGRHCPTSARVEVTVPGAYQPIPVVWHLTPYGGTTQDLRCGQITVLPVEAGVTATR